MDPELRALLDALPPRPSLPRPWPADGETAAQWRAEVDHQRSAFEALAPASEPLPEVAEVRGEVLVGDLRVRVYVPFGEGPHPAVVVLHGGGFWVGGRDAGLAAADAGMRLLCNGVGAVVVNVDYRQAPEHRFPTALEDAWTATSWAARLPDVDPARLALSGASAGANLVAGVALLSRTRGPALRLQQLLVPTLDATLASPSAVENGQGTDLTHDDLVRCWQLYLGPAGRQDHPLASPLLEEDLTGLPPAHIVVAEHDPLRDDGLRYAERLREAGVPVHCDRYPMTHAVATPAVGAAYLGDVVAQLKQALTP
jgi:acetyl esterase